MDEIQHASFMVLPAVSLSALFSASCVSGAVAGGCTVGHALTGVSSLALSRIVDCS